MIGIEKLVITFPGYSGFPNYKIITNKKAKYGFYNYRPFDEGEVVD